MIYSTFDLPISMTYRISIFLLIIAQIDVKIIVLISVDVKENLLKNITIIYNALRSVYSDIFYKITRNVDDHNVSRV